MQEAIRVGYFIEYDGPNVEGEISAESFAKSLLGLNRSIIKICSKDSDLRKVKIFSKAPQKGSFIVDVVAQVLAGLTVEEIATNGYLLKKLVKKLNVLTDQFKLKKFTKNKNYKIIPSFQEGEDKRVKIVNGDDQSVEVDIESAEVFQSKLVEEDIIAVVEALEKEKITSLKIGSRESKYIETIQVSDKEYFSIEEQVLSELQRDQRAVLKGEITRINKRRNSLGFLYKGVVIDCTTKIPDVGVRDNVVIYTEFLPLSEVKLIGIVHWSENNDKPIIHIETIETIQTRIIFKKE